MITANFYHIKKTNGLFFYGIDYLKENINSLRVVLIRKELQGQFEALLPNVPIVTCGTARYFWELFQVPFHQDLLFTPTSHPIPFIANQWIVFHDTYPFQDGAKGFLKRILFKISITFSQCKIGYINRSDCFPFLTKLGVKASRMIFAPNKYPDLIGVRPPIARSDARLVVGLVGTDSAKKNYDALFLSVEKAGFSNKICFHVYGHDTSYYRLIRSNYFGLQITLAKSDNQSVSNFLNEVDVLVSVAEYEGFGRLFASALLMGVPINLIDRPVFREFFDGGAEFHGSIDVLVQSLMQGNDSRIRICSYRPPIDVVSAFFLANREIHRIASQNNR